ncbi:hypothetical protein JYK22_40890, partial [Nonomuraea sp. RK-328]|nr:hypothetical protein [Nonomuraea sp. RK-328]
MTNRTLVAFDAQDTQILVEVETHLLGPERVATRDKAVAAAKVTFNQAVSVLRPTAQAIVDELNRMQDRPDEVEVTLGLKFTAGAAVLVASGSSESSCTVKMVWKKRTD